MEFADLKIQYKLYKDEIQRNMQEVFESDCYIMGPMIERLERALAQFAGTKHCVTVSSGTTSLEIALRALEIGQGDEVITVPFTWISTAEVIPLVGATPVFVDIDPDTYNMDASKVEAKITSRTKAIIAVSLFGQMADYELLNEIGQKYKIPIIEDGAQSFGSSFNGRRSCSVTDIGSTSFFPTKPLGCYGDGGALFTNNDDLAGKMRAIRTHGAHVRYNHLYIGLNGRLDALQAAVLLAKLPHFTKEIEDRVKIGSRYTELLKPYCVTPKVKTGNLHLYSQYTIRIPNRDHFIEYMKQADIPTAIHYPILISQQPAFSYLNYKIGDLPVAEKATREVVSLPMHPWLREDEQDLVVENIKNFVNKQG